MELQFYKQPFHQSKYGCRVYEGNGHFVFQFEPKYENHNYADGEEELMRLVLESLNSNTHIPMVGFKFTVGEDPNDIFMDDRHLITIRGWGNLTGIGGFHFPAEKATKIQDDFRDWILFKLNTL